MTDARTMRRRHGRGHSYLLDGVKEDGATTLLNKGFPKMGLVKWAAETVAGYAIDHWDELAELPPSQRLKKLAKAPDVDRDTAGIRGTEVHKLAQRLVGGEDVDVPEELRGHVESCVRFLDEWDVQPILVEAPVFSRRWKYAGSPDLVADLADGRRWLLDYKTNRNGPYGDVAFQLAAYRYADFYLDYPSDRRGTVPVEMPMPEVDECGVVWIRADGYDLYPFDADQTVFRQFLHIAQVAHAAGICRDYKGDALRPPNGRVS